jgi:hypothetical protein
MEILPLGAELFRFGGRTVITKLIIAFRNFGSRLKTVCGGVECKSLLPIGTSEWLFEKATVFRISPNLRNF